MRFFPRRRNRRRSRNCRGLSARIEELEDRTLLNADLGNTLATAAAVALAPGQQQIVNESVDPAGDVDVFSLNLNAGQQVFVEFGAPGQGVTFGGLLRLFDGQGTQLASDAQLSGPVLAFEAPAAGTYFVGVSDFLNTDYDPTVSGSGTGVLTSPYTVRFTSIADFDVSVHGQKIEDLNGNGRRDAGEVGLDGGTVILLDTGDNLVASTQTRSLDLDADGVIDPETERGLYAFTDLPPGLYSVIELPQDGFVQTAPVSGRRLFSVPSDGSNSITELNPQTGEELNRFPAPEPVQGFAADALAFDGSRLFFVNGARNSRIVWELNPDTGEVRAQHRIDVGTGGFTGLATLNGRVYILDNTARDIIELDPDSSTVTNLFDLNEQFPQLQVLGNLAASGQQNRLLVSIAFAGGQSIVRFDPSTGQFDIPPDGSGVISLSTTFTGLAAIDNEVFVGDLRFPDDPKIAVFSSNGQLQRFLRLPNFVNALGGEGVGDFVPGRHELVLPAGTVRTGVDFAHLPLLPDLVGSGVVLLDDVAYPGTRVQGNVRLQNRGDSPAGPFQIEIRLSPDETIGTDDVLLQRLEVPGVPAGQISDQAFDTSLPPLPFLPLAFDVPGPAFLGVRIDAGNAVAELDETNNSSRGTPFDVVPIQLAVPQETEPNETLATADLIPRSVTIGGIGPIPVPFRGAVAPGDVDVVAFQISNQLQGRMALRVHSTDGSLDPQLELLGPNGRLLATADDTNANTTEAFLVHHLAALDSDRPETGFFADGPRTFFARITGTGGTTGSYELTTQFTPATAPGDFVSVAGIATNAIAAADFNGDGIEDVAIGAGSGQFGGLRVFSGVGDGMYSPVPVFEFLLPFGLGDLLVDDFNGDGFADIAAARATRLNVELPPTETDDVVVVFSGLGNGQFAEPVRLTTGFGPVRGLQSDDFDGDDVLDLLVARPFGDDAVLFRGNGDATFQSAEPVGAGLSIGAQSVAVADFNEDGIPDFVTANLGRFDPALQQTAVPGNVSVFLGTGDGGFQEIPLPVRAPEDRGPHPWDVVTGDFNGDGLTDFAVSDSGSLDFGAGRIFVFSGNGDGTFDEPIPLSVDGIPAELVADDFNDDGLTDLATRTGESNSIITFLGGSAGPVQRQRLVGFGAITEDFFGLAPADVNADGRTDLVATSRGLAVTFLGLGDGSFRGLGVEPTGIHPVASVTADFNRDGIPDVATANIDSGDVSILLGEGNLRLTEELTFSAGKSPTGLAAGDFNRDGRLDLAVANTGLAPRAFFLAQPSDDFGNVSILLGEGNGRFRKPFDDVPAQLDPQSDGVRPFSIVTADFNDDDIPDLATSNLQTNDVSVLFGRGDGTFEFVGRLPVGEVPGSITTDDVNRDGIPDLVTANNGSETVSVLFGNGDGTFQTARELAVGQAPTDVIVVDFNQDGNPDLATANFGNQQINAAGTVSVLFGDGTGNFAEAAVLPVSSIAGPQIGPHLRSLVADDFDADGNVDLALANRGDPVDNDFVGSVSVLFGDGTGGVAFEWLVNVPAPPSSLSPGDFNNDGFPDLIATNEEFSHVQTIAGLPDRQLSLVTTAPNPVRGTPLLAELNGDGLTDALVVSAGGKILLRRGRSDPAGTFDSPLVLNPDRPARAVTVVEEGPDPLLAAVDLNSNSLSLYRLSEGSTVVRDGELPTGVLPTQITSGDLNDDGRPDLVVTNLISSTVTLYAGQTDGGFVPVPDPIDVGGDPSDLMIADVNGDGLPDVLLVNQLAGDSSVLINGGEFRFPIVERFNTGDNPYRLAALLGADASPAIDRSSLSDTNALVLDDFDEDGIRDLVVLNRGANTFAFLKGKSGGTFVDSETFQTTFQPDELDAGDFNNDDHLDLAILGTEKSVVSLWSGDGTGHFSETFRTEAGNVPTGITATDADGDGNVDALLGNEFGDLLILPGRGDGELEPFIRADRTVTLAVTDLDDDGAADVVLANQALDRVTIQFSRPGQTFRNDREDGIVAPGAVEFNDVDADGEMDLVVANTGGNSVLVYRGLPGGQFAEAEPFFAGTNPAGVTIDDANADGISDLIVANRGSNDVSILLGTGDEELFVSSLRLQAGEAPVSAELFDGNGDGIRDVVVSTQEEVTLLPGVGGGFFNDGDRTIINLDAPISNQGGIIVGDSFVAANPAANTITVIGSLSTAFTEADLGLPIGTLPGSSLETFNSGGLRPVSVLATDFNLDNQFDLIVANNGDGTVALLAGTQGGFDLLNTLTDDELLHPTSLAIFADPSSEGAFQLFVTDEAEDSASVFDLSLANEQGETDAADRDLILLLPGFANSLGGLQGLLVSTFFGGLSQSLGTNGLLPGQGDIREFDVEAEVLVRQFEHLVGQTFFQIVEHPTEFVSSVYRRILSAGVETINNSFGLEVIPPRLRQRLERFVDVYATLDGARFALIVDVLRTFVQASSSDGSDDETSQPQERANTPLPERERTEAESNEQQDRGGEQTERPGSDGNGTERSSGSVSDDRVSEDNEPSMREGGSTSRGEPSDDSGDTEPGANGVAAVPITGRYRNWAATDHVMFELASGPLGLGMAGDGFSACGNAVRENAASGLRSLAAEAADRRQAEPPSLDRSRVVAEAAVSGRTISLVSSGAVVAGTLALKRYWKRWRGIRQRAGVRPARSPEDEPHQRFGGVRCERRPR